MADNYIGLVTIGTNQNMPIGASLYGTCSTAAATAQKEVTLDALNRIFDGLTVRVKFTTANSAGAPTLKFSGMGTADPIAIKNYGAGSSVSWSAGAVIDFTYDGTNWVMHSNNTTYSPISEADVKDSTHTTARLITGQRVNQAIDNKLSALVDTLTGSPAASKTITAFDQVDGKVSATFANIAIAESQVTNLTTDLNAKAPIASPTFTGTVTLPGDPTSALHAATKQYVDNKTAKLTGAMHFKGSTSSTITDGGTQTVQIGGANLTPEAGDVVLSGNKEFVWTGSAWELLGDEGSYALKTITITGSNGLTGGGAISSNQVISHASRPATSATADETFGSSTARYYIKQIKVDSYGHIFDVVTGNETVSNSDTKLRTYRSSTAVELPIAGINTGNATAAYSAISSGSYKDVYAAIPETTANVATINPSTGKITATYFKGDGSELTNVTAASVTLANVTDADDLKAIEALSGSSGFLKKTAANTWTLDTNTYLTSSTQFTTHLYVTNSSGTAKTTTALTNGNVYLKLYDTTTARESYKITGSGITEVVTDTSGNITIKTKSYTATANTTINYLKDANYIKSASVTNGVLTITAVTDASTITPVTAINASF